VFLEFQRGDQGALAQRGDVVTVRMAWRLISASTGASSAARFQDKSQRSSTGMSLQSEPLGNGWSKGPYGRASALRSACKAWSENASEPAWATGPPALSTKALSAIRKGMSVRRSSWASPA